MDFNWAWTITSGMSGKYLFQLWDRLLYEKILKPEGWKYVYTQLLCL